MTSDVPATSRPARARTIRQVLEWMVVVGVAVVVALFVRAYVVQTYFIPSGSMEPTLNIGDRILVVKLAYRFTSPATGDVVVFKAPPAEAAQCERPAVKDLVKRIVGLPGQTISSQGDVIMINGHPLHQNWPHINPLGAQITTQTIPAGHYFMMGDNHPFSCDSRVWGTLPRSDIIGKAVLIFWPPSRFGTI